MTYLLSIAFHNFLFSQVKDLTAYHKALNINTDFPEYENYNRFQKDFFYLTEILEDTHPNIYNSVGKRASERLKGEIYYN